MQVLAFNNCAIALKQMSRLDNIPENECSQTSTPITSNQNKWDEDLNIYYDGLLIGTCVAVEDEDDSTPRTCIINFEA